MKRKQLFTLALAVIIGLPLLGWLGSLRQRDSQVATMQGESFPGSAGVTDRAIDSATVSNKAMIAPEPMPPIFQDDEGFTPDVDRVVVKTGSLTMVASDVRATVDKISDVVSQAGGLVTSSNIFEGRKEKTATDAELTLRIPVDKLEQTVSEIKKLADRVLHESFTAQDKTEQKVDLEARLRNLRATESQLMTIMTRATNVEETLRVQSELTIVRGQIEQLQAQLENLEGAAAMSTVTISITSKESDLPIVGDEELSIWEEIKLSLRDAVRLYRQLFVTGLRLSILALPAVLVIGLIWWLYKKILRK